MSREMILTWRWRKRMLAVVLAVVLAGRMGAQSAPGEPQKPHSDEPLAQELAEIEERQAKATDGLAQTEAERAAFQALAANRVADADLLFQEIHAADSENARALAGLGFVRMNQKNFGAAISYFTQAEANGLHSDDAAKVLAMAQFRLAMQQGTEALHSNHPGQAEDRFKAALEMCSESPAALPTAFPDALADALQALAGVYMQEQQPAEAIPLYQRLVTAQPNSEQAWRELFMAQAQGGNPQDAIATAKRFPPAVTAALGKDPEYLRMLAAAYAAAGTEPDQGQGAAAKPDAERSPSGASSPAKAPSAPVPAPAPVPAAPQAQSVPNQAANRSESAERVANGEATNGGIANGNDGAIRAGRGRDDAANAQVHLSITSAPVAEPETPQPVDMIAERPAVQQNPAAQTLARAKHDALIGTPPADGNEPPDGVSKPPVETIGATGEKQNQEEQNQPLPMIRRWNPREAADAQLARIEGSYTPWLAGTGMMSHRSGTAGFDQLTAMETPLEASAPLGAVARITLIVRPLFLDPGSGTTAPVLPSGAAELFGTLAAGVVPARQNVAGVGEEVQIATLNFAASAGYTPTGFLVGNPIGRVNWRPGHGPFTLTFDRDSVKDSQLSYSGMHDQGMSDSGSTTPAVEGKVWGGVIANAGEARFSTGSAASGYSFGGGGLFLSGVHVQNNTRIDGDGEAYWRVMSVPDAGNLTVGASFFGMRYSHNERYFTWGQGGYFSPQAYFLANVPVTWTARSGESFYYTITGAPGVQAFREDSTPYFPLDPALEAAANHPSYAAQSRARSSYDVHSECAYHLTGHWYAGSWLSFNNTRDYNHQMMGFFVHYLIRPQYPTESGPTGLFPVDGLRPFRVP
jgi:tetratricopeptide (TPR) repeat protein